MFELLRNEDSRGFIIRFALFLAAISAGFYMIKLFLGNYIPLPVISTNFDRNMVYMIFYTCLFFVMIKDDLKHLKMPKFDFLQTSVFSALTFASLALIAMLVNAIFTASGTSPASLIRLYYIELFLTVIPVLFAWLAVFNLSFSREFIHRFGNNLLTVVIMFLLTAIISAVLQQNWIIFSTMVAKATVFMLGITFNSTTYESVYGTAVISVGDFSANIGAPCSGIESASLFIFFYIAIVIWDWKKINRKLAAVLWIPGILGMFCVNILRIYVLMLVGYLISPQLASTIFHENAGWILFVGYIFLFWWLAYPKIIKKESEIKQ